MSKKNSDAKASPGERKAETLDVRLEVGEKEAFKKAADLAGIPMSLWVRERLRIAARRELEEAALPIPFLRHLYEGET